MFKSLARRNQRLEAEKQLKVRNAQKKSIQSKARKRILSMQQNEYSNTPGNFSRIKCAQSCNDDACAGCPADGASLNGHAGAEHSHAGQKEGCCATAACSYEHCGKCEYVSRNSAENVSAIEEDIFFEADSELLRSLRSVTYDAGSGELATSFNADQAELTRDKQSKTVECSVCRGLHNLDAMAGPDASKQHGIKGGGIYALIALAHLLNLSPCLVLIYLWGQLKQLFLQSNLRTNVYRARFQAVNYTRFPGTTINQNGNQCAHGTLSCVTVLYGGVQEAPLVLDPATLIT